MKVIALTAGLILATLTAAGAAQGFSGEAAELEHARANARAGGPVSDRDKELLERWGCTSGTDHPVCRQGHERRKFERRRPRKDYEDRD